MDRLNRSLRPNSLAELRQQWPMLSQFSDDQLRAQYKANAEVFAKMATKGRATGRKKVGGFTLAELDELQEFYNKMANATA